MAWFLYNSSYKTSQFTQLSMKLIRYSCGHISGLHEPIYVKFDLWGFSSCSYKIWLWKCWNAKTKIWWRHTSVLYTAFEEKHKSWYIIHLHNGLTYLKSIHPYGRFWKTVPQKVWVNFQMHQPSVGFLDWLYHRGSKYFI